MNPVRVSALGAALLLLPAMALAQPVITWFNWTGNATVFTPGKAEADAATPANWVDNTAPTSSSTTTGLTFGASSGRGTYDSLEVVLPTPFSVAGLRFVGPVPNYYFDLSRGGALDLGAAGIQFTTTSTDDFVALGYGDLNLVANQTWDTGSGNIYIHAKITEDGSARSVTKTGSGNLVLSDAFSTFSGGLIVQDGALYVGSDSISYGPGTVIRGPVGTGPLTLESGTKIAPNTYSNLTLHNALILGNGVTFGDYWNQDRFDLNGTVTPLQTNTLVRLAADGPVFFNGTIADAAGGPTKFTFTTDTSWGLTAISEWDIYGFAVLNGTNTYTGGTEANGAGVIFFHSGALPATGNLSALNGGYMSAAFDGGVAAIISKVADKAAFDGAIGLETDPVNSIPNTFNDAINLTGFAPNTTNPTDGFWGLGSMTQATLSATSTITPPTGGNYVFGGGDGTLYVHTALTAPTGVRVRSESGRDTLTVWLRGANSYTGSLLVDHSIVILDSATALPGTTKFQMDNGAYVGYTQNAGFATPADFIARLNTTGYSSNSVLGFDSPTGSRTVSDAIDLSVLTSNIFIGTTGQATLTSNSINAPGAGKQLSLTGIDGGWLTVDGMLSAGNVTSVKIGATGSHLFESGIVELNNPASNYAGGTFLQTGFLLLGNSSVAGPAGSTSSGPLGTGTLHMDGYNFSIPSAVLATAPSVTLHNNIQFYSNNAQFGVEVSGDSEDLSAAVQSYKEYGITLAGSLFGYTSHLRFAGPATFTLSGENSSLHAYQVEIGTGYSVNATRLIASHDNALGDTNTRIVLGGGADLSFTTANPAIGTVMGGDISELDTNNHSYVTLPNGTTLTINQSSNAKFWADIVGTAGDYSNSPGNAPTTASNASLVKNGPGILGLMGANNLTGGLVVNEGTVIFGSLAAANVGPITLNGGGIGAATGVTLTNPLSFGTYGGVIGGTGTFGMAVAVGDNVTLAPGASPGTVTFNAGLTFASGGSYIFEVQSNTAGGYLTDLASVTGTLAITSTISNPFVVNLKSLNSSGTNGALAAWDSTVAQSWTIASATTAITGFSTSVVTLDTSYFYSPLGGGSFNLLQSGNNLVLNFTPVPEPSTYVLMGLGLAFVGWQVRRRRTAR